MISQELPGAPSSPPEVLHGRALKQAFLRGAGMAPEAITAELSPEMMELLGKMMATSLQATIDLLALRSLVKQEVHADVTTVLVRNNNPLKFFPDSQTVLTQMLRKKMPGFMEPLEALDDAAGDLRGHQMGVVAGSRAGMQAALAALDPAAISASLPPAGLLDRLLPSGRNQQVWDAFKRRHAEVARGADEALFGAAFLQAYEAAVEQVKGDGKGDAA